MRRLLCALIPLLAAGLVTPVSEAAEAEFEVMTPASTVASRTDRRPNAGTTYDPVARKTFISWSGKAADTHVQAYDHRTGVWTAPKKIADGESDPHNDPTMLLAGDGHLLIFLGMHNTHRDQPRAARSFAGRHLDRHGGSRGCLGELPDAGQNRRRHVVRVLPRDDQRTRSERQP